jgi:hypothetical protein
MTQTEEQLSPKQAIDAARLIFLEFFLESNPKHLLLEGVEFDEKSGNWKIVFSFDVGRKKITNAPYLFSDRVEQDSLERRMIIIDGRNGSFVRMQSV